MAVNAHFVPDKPLYNDTRIAQYFSDSPLSEKEVRELILDLLERHTSAAPPSSEITKIHLDPAQGKLQGSASYVVTLTWGEKRLVAQYRKHIHRLDPPIISMACECYPDWVPRPEIYDYESYQISFSPYVGLSFAVQQRHYTYDQRTNAVYDYAKFVGQGCFKAREPDTLEVQQIQHKLALWATWKLGAKISPIVKYANENSGRPLIDYTESADYLFTLPTVFMHGDAGNGSNVLSNVSGHITGVIDWGESTWKPFGFGFLGLEVFLGGMGAQGYTLVEKHEDLRNLFWKVMWENVPAEMKEKQHELEEAVKLAKTIGTLFSYLSYYSNEGQVSDFVLEFMQGRLHTDVVMLLGQ